MLAELLTYAAAVWGCHVSEVEVRARVSGGGLVRLALVVWHGRELRSVGESVSEREAVCSLVVLLRVEASQQVELWRGVLKALPPALRGTADQCRQRSAAEDGMDAYLRLVEHGERLERELSQ